MVILSCTREDLNLQHIPWSVTCMCHVVLSRQHAIYFAEDYLPNGRECEDNPYKRDYNPCKDGYYCADDDLCGTDDVDCCKPKLQLNDICDDHKDCDVGLYCADKRDVGGRYDLCRPIPKKYSHIQICDKDYHCQKRSFCDERNCPRDFDADCCSGNVDLIYESCCSNICVKKIINNSM